MRTLLAFVQYHTQLVIPTQSRERKPADLPSVVLDSPQLGRLDFDRRRTGVTLRSRPTSIQVRAFPSQVRNDLSHLRQLVFNQPKPFLRGKFLPLVPLRDPNYRVHRGVRCIESELTVFTIVAQVPPIYRTG